MLAASLLSLAIGDLDLSIVTTAVSAIGLTRNVVAYMQTQPASDLA